MSDGLPKKPNKNESGIVNLDKSQNIGTHWICYWKQNNIKFVFDSYGGVPPKSLIKYLGENNLYYNDKRIQNFNSVICGHLCIKVLKLLSDH
jgi:hypothetical protein